MTKNTDNPLLQSAQIPALDKIQAEHFPQAMQVAIDEARTAIANISEAASDPTFENTAVSLDQALVKVRRINHILDVYTNAFTNDAFNQADEQTQKLYQGFCAEVFQNVQLASRFQNVPIPPDAQDRRLHDWFRFQFEAYGSTFNEEGQARVKEIDDKLITLASAFKKNLAQDSERRALLITDEQELEGLHESEKNSFLQNAANNGQQGWRIVPERLMVDDMLGRAVNPAFRKKLYDAFVGLCRQEPHDNEPIIKEMLTLRHERAGLIGYSHHADYAIARTMPDNGKEVEAWLHQILPAALEQYEESMLKIKNFARARGVTNLQVQDFPYWANQYKQQYYHFDEAELSQYLPLDEALQGFFDKASAMFNVRFECNQDRPTYHPDVQAYDVFDSNTNQLLGIMYIDLFVRPQKSDGAWMSTVQGGNNDQGQPAIVSINANLHKPSQGEKTLLSLDQLDTLFHEGGHALHGLLGNSSRHDELKGTSAQGSDSVEFYSKLMEKIALSPEFLKRIGRHALTGEAIPDEMLAQYKKSIDFLSEQTVIRSIANSLRDIKAHSMDPKDYTDSESFQRSVDHRSPVLPYVRPYDLPRFGHLFSDALSDYAAGYYGYLWADCLADIAIDQLNNTADTGFISRLREAYGQGSSLPPHHVFETLFGHKVTPDILASAALGQMGICQRA